MKNTFKIFAYVMVALMGLSITACSDDELITDPYNKSGVNLLAFGPCPMERTHEIRITGTNMTAVDKVIFPADETTEEAVVLKSEFNKVDAENIYLNIPDPTVPGKIRLVVGKDTIVSEGILTFEEPIEVTEVTPLKGLNAGDAISIKGDYVYNIASVTFTSGVEVVAEDFISAKRREIKVPVPLAAVSGTITMTDGEEWELEWEKPLEIISASVSGVSAKDVEFGDVITITGANLQTVETVMFAGGVAAEFTVAADNKSIEVAVPAECKSGEITLLLYSGNVVNTPVINVPEVEITSVSQTSDLCVDDVIYIEGTNLDRIVEIKLPGVAEAIKPEVVDGKIKIVIPEDMTDGDMVIVQNSSISRNVTLSIRKLSGVIWQGKTILEGWANNWGVFNWDGALWDTFCQNVQGAGQLTIHFKQVKDEPVFKAKMGDWGTSFSNMSIPETGEDPACRPEPGVEDLVINLTAEEADKMFGSGKQGIVLWGDGIQIQYVKWVGAAAEQEIWTGSELLDWGNNQVYIGSDTSPELAATGAKEGWIVRFYVEPVESKWQIQIFEGHWGPMYGAWAGETVYNEEGNVDSSYTIVEGNVIAIPLTQAMLDAAFAQQWWGGTFVVQGQMCKVVKVTVCPL